MDLHAQRICADGASVVLTVATLRGLPPLVAFYASSQPPALQKAFGLIGYALLAFLAARFAGLGAVPVLIAYGYAGIASGVPFALGGRCPRPFLLLICIAMFLVVPAMCFPQQWLITVIGWEMSMSSYSFCVDAKGDAYNPRSYAFFLLVNPALTYPVRGTRSAPAGFSARGAARAVRGLGALFISGAINAANATLTTSSADASGVASVVSRLAALYFAHTGLAALQIGVMRQLGYTLPERYDRVLSARSPAEFWTRWNTYIGSWARHYLFTPIVRTLRRKRFDRGTTRALAVVATFVGTGLLHDLYVFAQGGVINGDMTVWFAVNGGLVVAWHWAARQLAGRHKLGGRQLAFARGTVFAGTVLVAAAVMP